MQATSQDPMLPIEESRCRRDKVQFERGVALFNSRHFFEAHEAWEEIWLHTQPPEKTFLQGLIQVTAAFHHHSRENLRGFKSLLRAGLLKLEAFPAEHRGLQIERLRASARHWIVALENKDFARWPGLPKISRIKKSGEARLSIET
jgi:predicted metal-dependent hydrolase